LDGIWSGSYGPGSYRPGGAGSDGHSVTFAAQPGTTEPEDELGLPRRVRDDSMPQAAGGAARSPGGEMPSVRSPVGQPPQRGVAFGSTPEELGALAASLQRGWLDGRTDAAAEPDDS
jgi:hypothetical protein